MKTLYLTTVFLFAVAFSGCGIAGNVALIKNESIKTNEYLKKMQDSLLTVNSILREQQRKLDSIIAVVNKLPDESEKSCTCSYKAWSPDLTGYSYYQNISQVDLRKDNWGVVCNQPEWVQYYAQTNPNNPVLIWVHSSGSGAWVKPYDKINDKGCVPKKVP